MKKPHPKHLASCLLASLAVAFAAAPATAQSIPLPARWDTTQRGLILVPDEAHGVTMNLAVERLRSKSPIRFDLVDGARDNRTDFKNYDLTIILGVTGDNKELAQGWTGVRPAQEDAWALKTISTAPLVIVATGNRPRAVLYAVWTLADKLAAGDDISVLAEQHVPCVDKRYAMIAGTAYGGFGFNPPINRHTLYMADIDEMPRYGLNGVFLCPGMYRIAMGPGMVPPPINISKDGKVSVDETELPKWRAMLGVFKAYDMDVVMTIGPLVPPSYNARTIENDYIIGGKQPPGYLKAVETLFHDYLKKMIEALPDIDGYVLHAGVEGARYSGANIKDMRLFISGQNLDASSEAMGVYLKTADELARKYNKHLSFRTHQYGINSDGITAMRNVLFKYPRFTIIEEDFWPNDLWIHGEQLPIMAYLDKTTRDDIDKHGNKLGFRVISDAEYYGGGALPNAIAEPFIHSMLEILKRNTEMVIFRTNQHDRTPYGTLSTTAGIQLEQSANLLWQNPAPPQQVWDRWVKRTYGPAAAPLVSEALAKSYIIISDGIAGEIGKSSRFDTAGWMPKGGKIPKSPRPSKTTDRPPRENAVIESADQNRAQLHAAGVTRNVSYADSERKNQNAAAEVQKALALIEQARPALAKPDYAQLHEIFEVARIMIGLYHDMNQAAYAANLVKDNYDNNPDPKAYFERAITALEQRATAQDVQWLSANRRYVYASRIGQTSNYSDITRELQKLAAAYREFVKQ